jgi:hypothetical protein
MGSHLGGVHLVGAACHQPHARLVQLLAPRPARVGRGGRSSGADRTGRRRVVRVELERLAGEHFEDARLPSEPERRRARRQRVALALAG